MSDLRDFTGKNRKFTGTSGIRVTQGTEAQRVNTTAALRFNTNSNLMEYYTGSEWKPIDAPPVITGVSPTNVNGTSTTGVKRSTLWTKSLLFEIRTAAASSFSSKPTITFSLLSLLRLLRTWARSLGPILHAQPAPWEYWVSFILLKDFIYQFKLPKSPK